MKKIGSSVTPTPGVKPSAEALRAAAVHQATGSALATVATTGIRKGIYRFKSHAEMNRHTEEAQARAVALNVAGRATRR